MTEPRIGDTVRYRASADDGQCWAAIVCRVFRDGRLCLAVYNGDGVPIRRVDIPADTGHDGDGFTPGMWHHIH